MQSTEIIIGTLLGYYERRWNIYCPYSLKELLSIVLLVGICERATRQVSELKVHVLIDTSLSLGKDEFTILPCTKFKVPILIYVSLHRAYVQTTKMKNWRHVENHFSVPCFHEILKKKEKRRL